MTKNKNIWAKTIITVASILAVASFVGLLLLPDSRMGSPAMLHLSTYWLVLGVTHCILVLFLTGYWLVKVSKLKGLKKSISTKRILIIGVVILWLLGIVSSVRSGYLRNRTIKIPENMLPNKSDLNNMDKN